MKRNILLFHLYVAAFVAPVLIMIAISGGLYLVGIKGDVTRTQIQLSEATRLDFESDTLEDDVAELFRAEGIQYRFEYLRSSPDSIITRPTSRTSYAFRQVDGELMVTRLEPDIQKTLIELHKGHGPTLFKTYQKLAAVALILIVLSGVWMGLNSKAFQKKTAITFGIGFAVFVLLAFLV